MTPPDRAGQPALLLDTTLRDGELTPGVRFETAEKVEIACALADAGVDAIEAGFPGMYARDLGALAAVSGAVRGATVCALARAEERDIAVAAEALSGAERPRIHLFVVPGRAHRDAAARVALIERTSAMVRAARRRVASVELSPTDAMRLDPQLLVEILRAGLAAGARVLNLSDTPGTATPEVVAEVVARVAASLELPGDALLSFHGHDDRGHAVENSIAALAAGARQLEVALNGLGPRAGNTSLQGVLDALSAPLGVDRAALDAAGARVATLTDGAGAGASPRP